jgi:hypothetical protein
MLIETDACGQTVVWSLFLASQERRRVIPYTLVYDGASVGPWEIYLENIYGVF